MRKRKNNTNRYLMKQKKNLLYGRLTHILKECAQTMEDLENMLLLLKNPL